MYSGWELTESSKTKLKNMYPPKHPDFLGHHITFMFGKGATTPPQAKINLIGYCLTDKVECFVAEVNGSMVRPDGGVYHLTWSIDKSKGAKPVHSNAAIENNGFQHLDDPIEIITTPRIFSY